MIALLFVSSLVVLGHTLGVYPRASNTTSASGIKSTGEGVNLESASSCVDSKVSWAGDSGSTYVSDTVFITSEIWTSNSYSSSYATVTSLVEPVTYTLCDGWPRINGTTEVITKSTRSPVVWTSSYITTSEVSEPYPAPNCTIEASLCDILHSSFTSAEEAYNASMNAWKSFTATADDYFASRKPVRDYNSPICGSPTPWSQTSMVGPYTCIAQGATVQLLYWPVTRHSAQLCQGNASVATIGPTVPGKDNTAEYWGSALTSPTVYIALDGTWALTSSGTVHLSHSRVILPQNPTAVSSMCGVLGGGFVPRPFNYADLAGPPPASAYRCQPNCFSLPYRPVYVNSTRVYTGFTLGDITVPDSTIVYQIDHFTPLATENLCSTIWGDYRPALSIPPEFSTMAPVWLENGQQCTFDFSPEAIFWDPPKALIQANGIAGPSMPATTQPSTSVIEQPTPNPGSMPGPATPSPTKMPSDTPAPPTSLPETDDPAESDDPPIPRPGSVSSKSTPLPVLPGGTRAPSEATLSSNPAPEHSRGPTGRSTINGITLTASDGRIVTAIQPRPSGPVIIGSITLTPGQSTSYSGIGNIIANPAGLSVDGITRSFTGITTGQATGAVLTNDEGGKVIVSQLWPSGPVVIGDRIFYPDDSANIAGIGLVSIFADGILVDGKMVPFTALDPLASNKQNFFTAAGTTLPAGGTSGILLSPGITLQPGGPAVALSGHSISLAPGGAYLVIDDSTQWPTHTLNAAAAEITVDGHTYTADRASVFDLDGRVLGPGDVATISGVEVIIDEAGGYAVVDGVTQVLTATQGSGVDSGTSPTASSGGDGSGDGIDGPVAFESSSAVPVMRQPLNIVVAVGICFLFVVLV
ncbi:hypothetical protein Q7P37_009618 [Cladosporium fusiforme]